LLKNKVFIVLHLLSHINMTRKVVLARKFDHTLDDLAELTEEVNGILFYRKQEIYCPVEAIFITGKGTAGHVRSEQERINIVNDFFDRTPGYQFVKFHTHSKGTIRKFGDFYATHFSQGDIAGYDEQLKTNPDFIGMVATPTTKLLYAPDNPTLKIVNDFPSEANQRIHIKLRDIARTRGYDLRKLQARRK